MSCYLKLSFKLLILIFCIPLIAQEVIIINHSNCDPSVLTIEDLNEVRNLKVMFGHKSVGLNIIEGMESLQQAEPISYNINIVSPFQWANVVGPDNPAFGEWSNGQNYFPDTKIAGFDNMMRGGDGTGEWGDILDIAFFKYCFLDVDSGTDLEGLYNSYTATMNALINDYPSCHFAHVTVPLTGTNLEQNVAKYHYNEMIRDYVTTNGGYLFDLADCEAYDENGVYQSFEYDGGYFPMMWYDDQDSQNNGWSYDGGHLNDKGKNYLARAMWAFLGAMSRNGAASTKDGHNNVIAHYQLSQNFPNPFNPKTIINYELPITSDVELYIYNLLGEKVTTLVLERQNAGRHQVVWDASDYSSGLYYYSISTGEFQDVKKMVLIK